ncbi:helix-turn-helix transcriptional regulator [Mucilaginibacter sp.]|uniref:helix-turn-helix transcriptional regulator n=1 Tax=Mucilaginibacter sp. TaxID=1882438 RepID=UPI0035BC90F8
MATHTRTYLYRRVCNAKQFIDINYNRSIDLDEISGRAFFSKFHFVRIFKSAYGYTPHQYLNRVRMDKAKMLLQNGVAVADVCYAIGFESISTFTTLFKRVTGQSPAQYQYNKVERLRQIEQLPLKFIPNCFAERNGWLK